MFAVPGWSLSADLLKTQREAPQNASKSSKKRKRNDRKATENQTGSGQRSSVSEKLTSSISNAGEQSKRRKTEGRVHGTDYKNNKTSKLGPTPNRTKPASQAQHALTSGNEAIQKISAKERRRRSFDDKKPVEKSLPYRIDQTNPPDLEDPAAASSKLTPLQRAMRQKLVGAHFRHLNETLYTTASCEAQRLFDSNPSFFGEYHSGFRQQVSTWPENPINGFVQDLRKRANATFHHKERKVGHKAPKPSGSDVETKSANALPRTSRKCTIADLGCGDASLASQVSKFSAKTNLEVLSYDLRSTNSSVKKADIANLPLESGSVNVAILCLALMGTNWIEFVEEAYRILHWKGELWVAEIKSRFTNPQLNRKSKRANKMEQSDKAAKQKARRLQEDEEENKVIAELDNSNYHKDTTDVSSFVQVLKRRGFALEGSVDLSNKMFVKMRFVKTLPASKGKQATKESRLAPKVTGEAWDAQFDRDDMDDDVEARVLKPCLYKTR